MPSISPTLWFDTQAEEAAHFYTAIFPNSQIRHVERYGPGAPMPEGTVLTVDFTLSGHPFTALNGGPAFRFTEAVSFVIDCEDQAEVDHYWDALTADGGAESQCAWLKDRYGLSWQVVPRRLVELLGDDDPGVSGRVMQAMMQMRKIDIAALERAAAG